MSIILALALFLYLKHTTELGRYFTLDYIKSQQASLTSLYENNKFIFIFIFMVVYIFVTALSIPAAALLTLLAGAIFGLLAGTLIVSFASTIGATCAFLISRWLFSDYFKKRFAGTFTKINQGIEKEGSLYLFALRLIHLIPFFLINILMGLTSMKTKTFCIVSQLGMLPGTIAYINAGKELAKIDSLKSLLSPTLLIAFAILGLLPLLSKWLLTSIRSKKMQSSKILTQFTKPKKFDYNIIVIGAGSGGLVASYIGSLLKAKVGLIEKNKMGGDCLNTGCVPSKAFIRVAKIFNDIKRSTQFGINKITVDYDFSQIMEHIHEIIRKVAPHDSVERYTSLGVDCFLGEAKVLSPYQVQVNNQILTAKNIIIATGGIPIIPQIEGINEMHPFTTDTIWTIRTQPKHLIIIGGGPVSCELAQCFARIGTHVTIIQHKDNLLQKEDPEIGSFISQQLKQESVTVLTQAEPKKFYFDLNKQKTLEILQNNQTHILEFDELLVATGRKPNLQGFGLEDIGIPFSKPSKIEPSDTLQTNYPNIFICGDAAGSYQFTHYAAHQAWYAAINALFHPFWRVKVDNSLIPWCTFTDPEVARVGLNETQAKKLNIPYEITTYQIDDLDRAITDLENRGFIKILTRPNKDKILGVTIVSSHASDIILEFITAMKNNIGLDKILSTIHIYPTFGEANKYVASQWKKKHIPQKALKFLEKFHTFRRN
ncbi:MAG: pyridine nucleotide-disulfide oxidoreductase [Verrucomicrobia bacterium]|nr:MAG: pyridine nucleotide-disulfide oxidoreductase [Verrucomicrobiota bacterium]